MRRLVMLAAGALAAVIIAAGASASATEPLPTPQPDRLYLGRISYDRWMPITLKTSPDARRVKVAPGYFNYYRRCGAASGTFWISTLYTDRPVWMRVRPNKTFTGTGRAQHWMEDDARGDYHWKITGRFTSPRRAVGRITITGTWTGYRGPIFRCPALTVRWETRRTERASDSMSDF
jgi:hypothetical protein